MKGMLMSLGMFGCCMAVTLLAFEITSAVLFSQIELPPLEGASSLTSVGFAIWYGWYTTAKAIPRIIEKQTEQVDRIFAQTALQIEKLEAAHERQLNSLAATFRDEMRIAREHFQCGKEGA